MKKCQMPSIKEVAGIFGKSKKIGFGRVRSFSL